MDNSVPEIMFVKFADSRIPTFKESRNKDFIKYGEDNMYPEYLTYLYNKSAKHNAIVNGKASYIFGEGFDNGDAPVNRLGETLNDISRRALLDVELYGGFRFEIIWNYVGKVAEIYHADYTTIRKGKEGGYWFKESWSILNRDEETFIPPFDPSSPQGRQMYAYDEYRPNLRYYPLPGYIGCNNFIETDIEISKYYLSAIRNGMNPSKMIQFFSGEPTEDKKRQIEKSFERKFTGAENAGRFMMVFNPAGNAARAVEVNDLSGSDLDKMFVELNKTCQQEIFSGHSVTSPMLFGIKTEGQLGGTGELKTAYEIFVNTYAKSKANAYSAEVGYLMGYSMSPGEYALRSADPVGITVSDAMAEKAMTSDEVRERLGLPAVEKTQDYTVQKTIDAINAMSPLVANKLLENLTKNEIRALAALPALPDGDSIPNSDGTIPIAAPTLDSDTPSVAVNDNIKNLTAKQHQQLLRIIRQYGKGQLTELQAKALLRTGLGLSDEDINTMLGIAPVQLAMSTDEDFIIEMFDEYGESKQDYEILRSKKVGFTSELEIEADEAEYIQEAFKTYDVTITEDAILDLIKKDPKITAAIIATAIKQTVKYVQARIDSLVKRGYLESTIEKIGADEIIVRTVPKIDITVPPSKTGRAVVTIRYSYEPKPGQDPIIATTRPFCRKLIGLDRLYSRKDIETLSERLGYSVFDRKGGWWGDNPECRHRWVSQIVIKKGGAK